jgi:endonuclease-3
MSDPQDEKLPFDSDEVFSRLREAVKPFPKAAMFQLAEEGYGSVFHQLVGCIVSIRTRDEVTVPICRRLFAAAPGLEAVASLSEQELDRLISSSTFHTEKARRIRNIARITLERYGGTLPCDEAALMEFPGVGVKCAHLALGVACGLPLVSVDIHVHRITNRWGIIRTSTPEASEKLLSELLPERYRVEINRLLVPFGKHVCTGTLPYCSRCPVLAYCRQAGVERHR